MIAVIMCGGTASRMQAGVEKPLMKVSGVAMIEHVISALAGSKVTSTGMPMATASGSQPTMLVDI